MPTIKRTRTVKMLWATHRWIYRVTKGRLGAKVLGMPVLLLVTKGRKSGAERTNALMYAPHGSAYAVVGSNAGDPKHPAWVWNLRTTPAAQVELKGKRFEVTAREAAGAEREALWAEFVAAEPGYAVYEKRTEREIPVVVLDPTT